jgi:hypothetical protein
MATNLKFIENSKAKGLWTLPSILLWIIHGIWEYYSLWRTSKSGFLCKGILTQRTAIRRRHAAPMHEMAIAAIIPSPPPSSSETSSEVCPTGSTVVTWNHKYCYFVPRIRETFSYLQFHKQVISTIFPTINDNPHPPTHTRQSLNKTHLIWVLTENDYSNHVCILIQKEMYYSFPFYWKKTIPLHQNLTGKVTRVYKHTHRTELNSYTSL